MVDRDLFWPHKVRILVQLCVDHVELTSSTDIEAAPILGLRHRDTIGGILEDQTAGGILLLLVRDRL